MREILYLGACGAKAPWQSLSLPYSKIIPILATLRQIDRPYHIYLRHTYVCKLCPLLHCRPPVEVSRRS